jgi:phosphoglycolate phosphatase-like HAD superfamily hydrolase
MEHEAPAVVFDASVLFPFQVGHILTFMAQARLVRAHWSRDIEREWVERSLEKLDRLDRTSVEGRRDAMNRALPGALVTGYEHRVADIAFPDPDDRHVIAAALEAGALAIVSRDKRHFTDEALATFGLRRLDPDELLSDALSDFPEAALDATDRARRSLTMSRPNWDAYLGLLEEAGLRRFAGLLRGYGTALPPP